MTFSMPVADMSARELVEQLADPHRYTAAYRELIGLGADACGPAREGLGQESPRVRMLCCKVLEVAVMSLSAHEQQAPAGIADGLAHSDLLLAPLLATFNRLTSGEAMPASEKVMLVRRDLLWHARRLYARLGFQRMALIVWPVLGIALVAVALAASHGANGQACARSWPVCAGPVSGHPAHAVQKSAPSHDGA